MISSPTRDRPYFALEPGATGRDWRLPVTAWRAVGGEPGFLFGGVGLGASIAAVERTLGRATVWASAQYLSFAPRGATLDIAVTPLVEGRHTSQARAEARVGDRLMLSTSLSLGARPDRPQRQWAQAPRVAAPADCPPLPIGWESVADDLYSALEVRIARGWDTAEGQVVFWMRPGCGNVVDRPMLALMGDFVPASIGNALAGGQGHVNVNSLDNCMRFLTLAPTEWVLCDVSLHGAADGFAHGRMHLFAEDGTLLASASQSVVIRYPGFRPRIAPPR